MGRLITTTAGKAAVEQKFLEAPVDQFLQVWRAFLMGFCKKRTVGRGFLMVNSWWNAGGLWLENCSILTSEKHATFGKVYFQSANKESFLNPREAVALWFRDELGGARSG